MASSCCAGFISRVPHILCAVGTDDCWFKRWESGYAFVLLHFIQMLKVKRFIDCLKHIVGPWAVIYRWQQAVPPKMDLVKKVFVFLNFAYTVLVLNYSCVGFMVLSFSFISLLSSPQAKILPKQMFIVFSARNSTGTKLAWNTCCIWECEFHWNHCSHSCYPPRLRN